MKKKNSSGLQTACSYFFFVENPLPNAILDDDGGLVS